MFFKNNAIKRTAVYTAVVCLVLALSFPFLIQFLVNLKPVKVRISHEIEKYSGIKIQPDTIAFILNPFPGIRFLDVDLRFNTRLALTIDRTDVGIDLFQLFNRRIAARQIEFIRPRLIYTPAESDSSSQASPEPILTYQMIYRGLVDKLFTLFPDSPEHLEISIKEAKGDYFETLDARLKVHRNKTGLSFTARTEGIDLRQGQVPEFDKFTAGAIERFKARALVLNLNLDPANTLSGSLKMVRPEITMTQRPGASLNAPLSSPELVIDVSLSTDFIQARLVPNDITYPQANLGIEFNHRIGTGNSSIIFSGRDIDISDARDVCLPLLKGVTVGEIIFDILRAGRAKDIIVGFKAKTLADLFDGKNLTLTGTAADATVKIPGVPLTVNQVSGNAELKQGVLCVEVQKGEVRSAQINKGRLNIDLMNYPDEPFSGKFHLKANLSRLPGTLMELLPGTRLAEQLTLVSEMEGQADGLLELDMPSGAKELSVRVKAESVQASGRYGPIPLPLSVSQGEFLYNSRRIRVTNINGTIGRSAVKGLNGEISLEEIPVLSLEQAEASLSTQELIPWIKARPPVAALLLPVKNFSGPLNLSAVKIQGPLFEPNRWQFDVKGAADKIHLGFTEQNFSARNISCVFELDQDRLAVDSFSARIDDLTWLRDKIDPNIIAAIKMPLYISEGAGLKEKKTNRIFSATLKTAAGPVVSFKLAGTPKSEIKSTRVIIKDEDITDALIVSSQAPNKPKISFQGHLNTLTVDKLLVKDSTLYNQLFSVTQGNPIDLSTDGMSRIYISTKGINLDSLLSHGKTEETKESQGTGPPFLAQKELVLKADRLIYKAKPFTQVDTQISFDPGITKIRINQATLCDLTVKGNVDLGSEKDGSRVTTDFDISSDVRKDISHVFSCLFGSKSSIEGRYTFKGRLAGNDRPDRITRGQNGEFSFVAEQGRIYKATVLSRVLSVLNIMGDTDIRQKGFGYKTLTVTADVKDSVIHLKKAYIDADDMAIIASGWVDPLNDQLDVTFLVAPFKTIDTIIQYIPLVSTILSGRLVSFPAKALGKISDPSVIPLHPSAVGTGLLTLFGDLLNAPVRLMKGE